MYEYKKAFNNACYKCINDMLLNDKIKYKVFFRQIKSINLLLARFTQKIEASNSIIIYQALFKEYSTKLDILKEEAIFTN